MVDTGTGFGNIFAIISSVSLVDNYYWLEGMKEDKKIGYLAIIVGAISLWEAWVDILNKQGDFLDIVFLSLGLISSLFGIALIVQKKQSMIEK